MTAVHELGKKWAIEVKKLHELEVPKFLEPKKAALMRHAKKIRDAMVTGEPIVNAIESNDGLGFLPVVPLLWATAGTAVTAMLAWLGYTKVVTSTAGQADTLKKAGMNDKQIENLLTNSDSTNKYVIGGIVAVLGAAFILSRHKK